jgi:hypothetical protein
LTMPDGSASQENLEAARGVWELFSEGAGSETPASKGCGQTW